MDTAEINPLLDAPDDVFLDHLRLIYSESEVQKIGWQLESFRAGGLEESAAKLWHKYLKRMRDIPTFMKELKQRFYPSFAGLSMRGFASCGSLPLGVVPLAQPPGRPQRPGLGGSLQERAGRGRRDRVAHHRRLH